jgi:pimeloyl-ACP methyl ester carboxylesterase
MTQPTFQMLDCGEVRLRTVVEGEGPLCVLVHGWPESWYSWRHQIDALVAAGYRVAAPDVRGYGGSDKPEAIEAYDMVSLTDDVVGLIDALGEKQAILIGHDWGAPIVWVTAIRYPERVRAVIGMSVPHLGQGKRPAIEIFRELYADRFFYQLYFQQPGVAEQELEADPGATIRKVYYNASGDITDAERTFGSNKGPDATMLEGLTDPDQLAAAMIGAVPVDDHRQRVHAVAVDQHVEARQRRGLEVTELVVERRIAAAHRFQPVEEVQHDLRERQLILQ